MTFAGPAPVPEPQRIPGIDLARFVAIAGMVLVHAQELTGDQASSAAAWLETLLGVPANRARLLFFLLAGVGVALVVRRRDAGTSVLLRRAVFLATVGALLVLMGWGDLVLVFYGVLFVLAVLLARLSSRLLLVVAPVVAVPGVLRLAIDPVADDTLTNILLVLGEMVPLFCLGLAIGRANLADRSVVRMIGRSGALLAVPGLIALSLTNGLDVTEVEGRIEPVAALTSTAGACLLVLALCLSVRSDRVGRLAPVIVAGGMPLSAYVGHALLFPAIARQGDLDLYRASLVALAYLLTMVLFAWFWRRRRGAGPVEALMRRFSGPHPRRRSAQREVGEGRPRRRGRRP
ncbi:DUF418 domain-containing protein [Nocardioides stalactiti]|uniref:DUF418 domain-containing protein n=1 Tax=Nocardioides stalactiti TaxID=2755356 RepID=UPI0016040A8E|nr:DUF418 domain-containing protein [Nocardioides stalactiti]